MLRTNKIKMVKIKKGQVEAISAQGVDARYIIEVGVQCSLRQLRHQH